MRFILIAILLSSLSLVSRATKVTATGDGNWSQNSTWDDTHPGCYDTICIPAGITVTITATENLEACGDTIIIDVYGTLAFQTGKKLNLPCGSDIYINSGGSMGVGGGGGSSTYVEICGDEYWNASSGDITGPAVLCGSGDCVTLPIELVNFKGVLDDSDRLVHLSWITKSETNNDYFIIEKSIDGVSWEFLGDVDGAGTSSIELSYYLPDGEPYLGINYYRLTQYDYDGAFETTSPIAVLNNGVSFSSDLIVVGSESTGLINVFLKDYKEETVVIGVYSLTGQQVYYEEVFINDDGVAVVDFKGDLAFGSYVLKASQEVSKVVVK